MLAKRANFGRRIISAVITKSDHRVWCTVKVEVFGENKLVLTWCADNAGLAENNMSLRPLKLAVATVGTAGALV